MTDHITAAELRARADRMTSKRVGKSEAYRRAAAALDALDARIAELEEEVELARTGWAKPQWTADAELGALVREVGAHPEAKGRSGQRLRAQRQCYAAAAVPSRLPRRVPRGRAGRRGAEWVEVARHTAWALREPAQER
jgi:hypothetical protein